LLVGLVAALAFTRVLASFLYHVPALDPITFLLAPLLLSVAAFIACLIPSCRASAIDPMNALRHE
jgi:putative ABC transport system permease protein